MVRGFQDVRKIIEPIEASVEEAERTPDAPAVINATDAAFQNIVYSPVRNEVQFQIIGPDPAKIRINGDAGIIDGTYNYHPGPDTIFGVSGLSISKVSIICDAGETCKVVVTGIQQSIGP